jgi:hypothetical protein
MELERRSAKIVLDPLKPTVLVLARLLPITVIAWPLVFKPLTPLYNALEIPMFFSCF